MNVIPATPLLPPARQYEFEFLSRRRETPSSSTFWFSTRGTGFEYRSNQAVRLLLSDSGDPRPWRLFSLSSSPTETDRIAVTATTSASRFKQRMERLEPGESVTATGPWGDLFYNPNRPAVFLAGGIGVTPFRGMMRFAADSRVRQPIVLLYTARTPEDLAFRTEFDRIVREHPHFRVEYSVTRPAEATTGWEGRTGRIDEAWIREAVAKLDRPKVYVAGLPRMARETVLLLQERLGFLEEDLEYEYFMGYR